MKLAGDWRSKSLLTIGRWRMRPKKTKKANFPTEKLLLSCYICNCKCVTMWILNVCKFVPCSYFRSLIVSWFAFGNGLKLLFLLLVLCLCVCFFSFVTICCTRSIPITFGTNSKCFIFYDKIVVTCRIVEFYVNEMIFR